MRLRLTIAQDLRSYAKKGGAPQARSGVDA
jgi:hypothetical protein